MVLELRPPFRFHVIEGVRRDDAEAYKENISLGVRERAETIIIFLTGSIPKTKVDRLAIYHDIGTVVIEDSGNVFSGEGIGGVGDEEACLTDSSVTDDNTLDILHGGNWRSFAKR